MSIFDGIKRFFTPNSQIETKRTVTFDYDVKSTVTEYADHTSTHEEERAVRTAVSWSDDHLLRKTAFIFKTGESNAEEQHIDPVVHVEIEHGSRIITTTYGDEWIDETTEIAKLTEVSYSEDPPIKTTVYTFAAAGDKVTVEEPDERTKKEKATDAGESYVEVMSLDLEKDDPSQGFFELDWNELFVDELREAGYNGHKDEEIVDEWFTELCSSISKDKAVEDVINPPELTPRRFVHEDGKTTEYR